MYNRAGGQSTPLLALHKCVSSIIYCMSMGSFMAAIRLSNIILLLFWKYNWFLFKSLSHLYCFWTQKWYKMLVLCVKYVGIQLTKRTISLLISRAATPTWAFIISPPSVIIKPCVYLCVVSPPQLLYVPACCQWWTTLWNTLCKSDEISECDRLLMHIVSPYMSDCLFLSKYPLILCLHRVGILLPQFHQLLRHDRVPGLPG